MEVRFLPGLQVYGGYIVRGEPGSPRTQQERL